MGTFTKIVEGKTSRDVADCGILLGSTLFSKTKMISRAKRCNLEIMCCHCCDV